MAKTTTIIDDPIIRVRFDGSRRSDDSARPVDAVAVFMVDPSTNLLSTVYASDGLCQMLDYRRDQLYGRPANELYSAEAAAIELAEVKAILLPGYLKLEETKIDLNSKNRPPLPRYIDGQAVPLKGFLPTAEQQSATDAGLYLDNDRLRSGPISVNERLAVDYRSLISLKTSSGKLRAVHATYSVIPSLTPGAPYLLAQFCDLNRQSVERLVVDRSAIAASLDQGHELGRLCHQICSELDTALGPGHHSFFALNGDNNELATVVAGGLAVEFADLAFQSFTSQPQQLPARPMHRRLDSDSIPPELARQCEAQNIAALWFAPITGIGEALSAAVIVASSKTELDPSASRVFEHHVALLSAAISHSRTESSILHHVLHDALTHLPNRALLVDRLGQAVARLERDSHAMTVLLVDIDRFRNINNTRGVEIGDKVLVEVANRLLAAVRLGDTVGRISSDQFLVICVATNGELDTEAVAERIIRMLDVPVRVGAGEDIRVTVSIGALVVDDPSQTPTGIIANAESALAKANSSGRGRFAMYEAGYRDSTLAQHELEQDLHTALSNDELVVHYQPIVEMKNGFMVAAEALVRWERPGHGLLPPAKFVPVAEECDLVVPLGEWVIDKVCSDLARWPKSRGRSPMVTVNLSARHLELDTLVPCVISALHRNDLHPPRLGFEITESMKIANLAAATVNLRRLAHLGCRIAIDDFGIGHATLDYLRRFSMANVLKIDRSFISGMGKSSEDTAIVNASIALAGSLGMQVIAEGVESLDQIEALRVSGCRYGQGYGLGRPMPFEDVLALWQVGRVFESERLPNSQGCLF